MTSKFNTRGFTSIIFLFFLSLTVFLVFSYAFISYVQKQKGIFKKFCYGDLAQIQKETVQYEKNLFRLNPLSSFYRTYLIALKANYAAAIASQNYPLASQLHLEIIETERKQEQLDVTQKKIISSAQLNLKSNLNTLKYNIESRTVLESFIWLHILKQTQNYELSQNAIIAVQPDSIGGIAPNYELQNQYNQKQQLRLNLQISFKNKDDIKTIISTEQSFENNCNISFEKRDEEWFLKINQGKY